MLRRNANNCRALRTLIGVVIVAVVTLTPSDLVATTETGAQSEGIEVHGDWTIEIQNADGSTVSRHFFRNKLHGGGPSALASLLVRKHSVWYWSIALESGICNNNGQPWPCFVTEPAESSNSPVFSKTLKVEMTGEGSPAAAAVLSGTATAQRAGSILSVSTSLRLSPQQTFAGSFTGTSLPKAIPVAEGQIIQVKVVISFS